MTKSMSKKPRRSIFIVSSLRCLLILAVMTFSAHVQAAGNDCKSLAVDLTQSTIKFEAGSTFHGIEGQAKKFEGKLCVASGMPKLQLSGDFYVKTESLVTGNSGMDTNMHKMFEVEKYPQAHCKIESFTVDLLGLDKNKAELKGVLTIKGKSVPFEKTVTAVKTQKGFKVQGQLEISLKSFDLKPPTFFFLRVSDKVTVKFDITALRV